MDWKQILRQNFTNWLKLSEFLEFDQLNQSQILVCKQFPLNLPYRLAAKIQKNTWNDPILKQFLPHIKENEVHPGFVSDPVQDVIFRKEAKLLHKYSGRILMVTTSACAMHCRYCFRKNFDYEVTEKGFENEIKSIQEDASIEEVILSGGDPLSLSNEKLQSLLTALASIPHLKRLRFHTRFPIGIPERLDDAFIQMIERCPFTVYFVVHSNHATELDEDVLYYLKKVRQAGAILLNQSVLLKDVNDSVDALVDLLKKLCDNGILPYYLHQLDRVQGAAHFEVEESYGLKLIEEARKRLPGYAIPEYVREIANQPNKTPINVGI